MVITLDGITGSGELWLDIVRIICRPSLNKSDVYLCDLMCHTAPYTSQLEFYHTTFVDVQYRGLENCKEKDFVFYRSDVFDFLDKSFGEFEVMICADGIEHLSKENGQRLIEEMEEHSEKQIVFTPLGELSVTEYDHPDSHKSGWYPTDFEGWAFIVLPNFHPTLNCGAFFAFNCSDKEKQRIYNEIKIKYVESRID